MLTRPVGIDLTEIFCRGRVNGRAVKEGEVKEGEVKEGGAKEAEMKG